MTNDLIRFSAKEGVIDICAANRLTPLKLAELEIKFPGVTSLYQKERRRFLNEWFALIELEFEHPVWSTFPQRLDYVLEMWGGEMSDLVKVHGVDNTAMSRYRNRDRCGIKIIPEDKNISHVKRVIHLIRACNVQINFAWVMQGSSTSVEQKTEDATKKMLEKERELHFRSRCLLSFKALLGKGYRKDAAGKVRFSAEILGGEQINESQKLLLARDLASLSGGSIDPEWVLTGQIRPPQEIQDCMNALVKAGRFAKWNGHLNQEEKGRAEHLLEILRLIESRSSELSKGAYEFALNGILTPLARMKDLTSFVHLKDGGFSEDDIRERRGFLYRLHLGHVRREFEFKSIDDEFLKGNLR